MFYWPPSEQLFKTVPLVFYFSFVFSQTIKALKWSNYKSNSEWENSDYKLNYIA